MREILLHIEVDQQSTSWSYELSSEEDFARYYTAKKLSEAGLIAASVYGGIGDDEEIISIAQITFAGHQFLENIREPTAWSYVKTRAAKASNFGLTMLVELGKAYAEQKLKEIMGLPPANA